MPIFKFGQIIKQRREELGYTQEELADGICSVPTLSRIENGERMPTTEHFEMLIQRLGYSDTMIDAYADKKQFLLHEIKFQIRQAIIMDQFNIAENLLIEYQQYIDNPTPIEKQFITLCQTIIKSNELTPQKRLENFEAAIRLTCPKYNSNKLPCILSFEEILTLNNIAVSYSLSGDYERAIEILYHLKNHYDRNTMSSEEILRTQPLILYNLSKYLGCVSRYDECIEICDLGIRIARETGRCSFMDGLLYNRAWSLLRRKHYGDIEAAYQSGKLAYDFAAVMENEPAKQRYRNFLDNNFS